MGQSFLNPTYNIFQSQHFSKVYKKESSYELHRNSNLMKGNFLTILSDIWRLTLIFCLWRQPHWTFLLENSFPFKMLFVLQFFDSVSFLCVQQAHCSSVTANSCFIHQTTWERGNSKSGKISKAKPAWGNLRSVKCIEVLIRSKWPLYWISNKFYFQ